LLGFEFELDSEPVRRIESVDGFDISALTPFQKSREKTKALCRPSDNAVAIASLFDIIGISRERQG